MPVVTLDYRDLVDLLGEDPGEDVLRNAIPAMGADLDKIEDGEIEVEFFPNRPDLYSVEGVARALKHYMGFQKEPRSYNLSPSGYTLTIESSIKDIRPYMVSGVVRNVIFDDGLIKSIMQVQEKLHATMGRGRKKVSIGIHDLDKTQPPYYYRGCGGDVCFVPLGWEKELTMDEILTDHEKGKDYAHIVEGKSLYPLFVDNDDNVLSFPPIINGVLTEVNENTQNVLLDVTGTDKRAVNVVLNILMALFAERGGTLQTVDVIDGGETETLPNLSYTPIDVDVEYANRFLGLDLSLEDAGKLLAKMGYGYKLEGEKLVGLIPPYRADILHPVDIVEDMAIAYGYENFNAKLPQHFTPGSERAATRLERRIRQFMVGMGFLEVMTFTLIGKEDQYQQMRLEKQNGHIINPITRETNSLRSWLIPSLLQTLQTNRHRDLPQRLFEVDDVVVGGENRTNLAGAIIASKTGFTDIKSHVQAVVDFLGIEATISPKDHSSFLPGRCAGIEVDGKEIGYFGEIHPEVITNHELGYPVTAFEIKMDEIE